MALRVESVALKIYEKSEDQLSAICELSEEGDPRDMKLIIVHMVTPS